MAVRHSLFGGGDGDNDPDKHTNPIKLENSDNYLIYLFISLLL